MRKTNIAIYAAAALGLCLMSPNGAAAIPASTDIGKVYSQAARGENGVVKVHRVYRRGVVAWRGGHRGYWRRGYYGGLGPGYGLGLGWGWPFGLGVGFGAAATDWGYPGYYGGYYPAHYRRCGCY